MNQTINDKLALENKVLSDDNIRLRKAYYELLNDYLLSLQNKMPGNLIESGRKYWESKIN
jgi:hypothetical protein